MSHTGTLQRVHDGGVAQVGPAVVHVEDRDVDRAGIGRGTSAARSTRTKANRVRLAWPGSRPGTRAGRAPGGTGSRRAWTGASCLVPGVWWRGLQRVRGACAEARDIAPATRHRALGTDTSLLNYERRHLAAPDVTLARPELLRRVRKPARRPRTGTVRSRPACRGTPPGTDSPARSGRPRGAPGSGAAPPRCGRVRHRVPDGRIPRRGVTFPAEDDSGAAVFVVRLDDQLLPPRGNVLEQRHLAAPGAVVRTSATRRVHGTWAAMIARSSAEKSAACRGSVSTAKNAFLCGILQRSVLAMHTARAA